MTLDISTIRSQFPGLNRPDVFFDNPGGTQIAKQSLDRINRYLIESNANHEGAFATSIASDAVLDEAHRAMADFYNAASPEEIVFGNNMTTLTLHISSSISDEWKDGDEFAERLAEENYTCRRLELKKVMAAIQAYGLELGHTLPSAIGSIPGLHIYGLTDGSIAWLHFLFI